MVLPRAVPDSIFRAALAGRQAGLREQNGEALSYAIPIKMEGKCLSCHGYENSAVLGVLAVRVSLAPANALIEQTRIKSIASGLAGIFLLGGVIFALVRIQILHPVNALAVVTSKIASGDMSARTGFKDNTELGLLAQLFDDMAEKIQATTVSMDYVDSIMQSVVDCLIVTDTNGDLQSCNRAACTVLGLSLNSLKGQNVRDIMGMETVERESLISSVAAGRFDHVERTFDTPDSNRSILLFSAALIEGRRGRVDGIVFTGKDITYLKQIKDELVKSKDNFYSIVLKSADGILVICKEGTVHFSNPAAERMLGRKKEDLHGVTFGFPMVVESMTEVDIVRQDGKHGTAEMRVVDTYWHGEPAVLVSLRDVTSNVRLRDELRDMSLKDELTGLYNRRGFFVLAKPQMKTARRMGRSIFILYADMNGFKNINDHYGHQAGDLALREAARILIKTFRDSDIVARMGGDEFVVMTLEETSRDGNYCASRLAANLDDFNKSAVFPFALSMSMGTVCDDPSNLQSIEDLLVIADKLMYQDKINKKV